MNMLEFLRDHFWHAFPILVAGAFAVAIIAERIRSVFFHYPMKDVPGFFDRISQSILTGQTAQAIAHCDAQPSKPLANIVKAALLRAHLPDSMIQHGIEYALNEASQLIRKRTAYLATIANIATLLGLFGTIAGLIHSFEAVAHADPQQKSALLSAGIATAMNATMLGLGVAIPAMVFFSFIMNRSNRLLGELENGAVRTLEVIKQRFYSSEFSEKFSIDQNHSSSHSDKVENGADDGQTASGKVVNLRRMG